MPIDKPMDPLFNQDDFEMGPQGFTVVEEEIPSDEPTLTETEDGGMLVDFDPEGLSESGDSSSFESNLAEHIEDGELNSIAMDLISKFNSDKSSRSNWEQTYEEGLDYLDWRSKIARHHGLERVVCFTPCCRRQWFNSRVRPSRRLCPRRVRSRLRFGASSALKEISKRRGFSSISIISS